ncbi:ABC transporter permease [Paracoccus aminophilus]|uniref:ABC-type dipeptide/oligopeptide/nickel transport systems, permease component n=1 Tax=Paracoccus aminophilus JCM 7686 TaxID=1367847 RepID=S5Z003_PARAH|nr:ABC transporter permease [Paracoccus aminophilus]AGT10786.1 ABC-type dipeptide/oligopeptide/nickel transport systems, permease component [Paracoccus aminophilus JCM 7686]
MFDILVPETGRLRLPRINAALLAGVVLGGLILLAAIAAPLVAGWLGHGPNEQFRTTGLDMMGLPVGPGAEFPLGSDGFGRDVLVRTLYGTRVSLLVGVPATALALLIGTAIGLVSGWSRGWGDRLLGRFMDVVLAFPFVLTALALATLNRGPDGLPRISPELLVTIVIALFSWIYFARLVRGLVKALRSGPMVEAAQVSGARMLEIFRTEILPVVAPKLVVFWAVQLPVNIVAEATLSFLGVGIAPPTPSLGNMIAEAQRSGLYQEQVWLLLAPGLALFLTVAAANLLAAGLRSQLDPHDAQRG